MPKFNNSYQEGMAQLVIVAAVLFFATTAYIVNSVYISLTAKIILPKTSQDLKVALITSSPSATLAPSPTTTPTPAPTVAKLTPTPHAVAAPNISGTGYSNFTLTTQKGDFSVSVLSLDLNSVTVMTDTANDADCANSCNTVNLVDFVNKNNGFAGINGSYFCPDTYSDCTAKTNSFDFPVYNTRLNKWINQGNLFWDGRSMFYIDGSGAHYKQNAKEFSGGLLAGITNYPGILNDGNVQIDDNQSGLSDKQKAKGSKVGIGLKNSKNIMVVIAQNVNMQEFAHVFKSLGATGALNLDTGGSTALYYNGSYLAGPGRSIPNAIIFKH